ncbi:MAG: ATP-binding cassette domain-containing protein [Granulosicoccus sp.]|nr:ATP-binding cassette domain-containing protein [Granulosicoccus sp.]
MTTLTHSRPITASGLCIRRSGRQLLNVKQLSIAESGCTVIVGPNGAGKSLLIKSLCGLQKPDSGSVYWAGTAPERTRRRQVGLLLQHPVLLKRTARANLVYALRHAGSSRRAARTGANQALEKAALMDVADIQANRLSGGEQQRLALARALLLEPEILFLDEATAHVDPASTLMIEQQLTQTMQRGLCVVLVSHDIGQVRRLADHVVLMHMGEVVEQCAKDKFFSESAHPTSQSWIAGELLV